VEAAPEAAPAAQALAPGVPAVGSRWRAPGPVGRTRAVVAIEAGPREPVIVWRRDRGSADRRCGLRAWSEWVRLLGARRLID
jgi:hypothetical protein